MQFKSIKSLKYISYHYFKIFLKILCIKYFKNISLCIGRRLKARTMYKVIPLFEGYIDQYVES